MRIEQILTLLNINDGIYRDSGKVLIKKANSVTIADENDCTAVALAINPNVKIASSCEKINLFMPSATSRSYTQDELKKIASACSEEDSSLENKIQKALTRLSANRKALPDVNSIVSLASMMSASTPRVFTFKFAQWGGSGGMSGNEGGSFKGFSFQPGGVNEAFGRWQANSMFDEMLGTARKNDKNEGLKSVEGKLAEAGFYSHKYADENAEQYNLTFSERIRNKNLKRLKRMFEDRKKTEKKENEYTPEYIRLNEQINPRHYESLEAFLEDQRGAKPRDYAPKHGRLDERVPEWHKELGTLRRNSFNLSKIQKLATRSRADDVFDSAPGRRRTDPDNYAENEKNYAGGVTGAGANIMNQPSQAEADAHRDAYGTTENEPSGDLSPRDADFWSSLGENGGEQGERPSVSDFNQGDTNLVSRNSNGIGELKTPPMFDESYYESNAENQKYNEKATTEEKLDSNRPKQRKRRSVDEEGGSIGSPQWNNEAEYEGVTDQHSMGRRNGPGQTGWV